jgi:outer membrane protein OmpA-like peptidoglycan-associated protein
MKITTALLAGTVIPTLVLLFQPAHAESASGIVVAQAQPEKDKPKPAPAKPAKPAPPAAKPAPPPPAATRPAPPPPAAARPASPPPAAARPAPLPPAAATPAPPPPAAATPTPPPPAAANPAPTARPFVQPGKPVPVAKPAVVPPPAALRGPRGRSAAGVAAPAAAVAPTATPANVRRMDDFRSQRREVREGDRTIIREPGRTIIKEGNVTVIRRDESDRFRYGARNMIAERRGNELRTIAVRPDGSRIINVTDDTGRLVRRLRRDQFGRESVMFDNSRSGMGAGTAFGIGIAAGFAAGLGVAYLADVPPPVITIPQDQYIVDTRYAPPAMLYDTLAAPPIDAIERPYTLDEIRYTRALRQRMRSVDINTLTFDSGSFELRPDQYGQLEAIANAVRQVTEANPNEVFLIEGHTDAVGTEEDNISLSDRRAEAIAVALTEQFQIPPENLTTQGYGEQQLKVPVQGPNEQNRRITVRRITPLLAGK